MELFARCASIVATPTRRVVMNTRLALATAIAAALASACASLPSQLEDSRTGGLTYREYRALSSSSGRFKIAPQTDTAIAATDKASNTTSAAK